jgi:hypothetical protein
VSPSGHPGTPTAMAPVACTLWQRFLRLDPEDPIWPDRDLFVLSAGHASTLLYALLHLTGVRCRRSPASSPVRSPPPRASCWGGAEPGAGGLAVGPASTRDLVRACLGARHAGAQRQQRRLDKISAIEAHCGAARPPGKVTR